MLLTETVAQTATFTLLIVRNLVLRSF